MMAMDVFLLLGGEESASDSLAELEEPESDPLLLEDAEDSDPEFSDGESSFESSDSFGIF